jgi:CRISPR/Cas system-associated protein endoribonuclease Cas2
MMNEIMLLTYSIQDSIHDLELHVDEDGRVILDVIYKDFAAMRNYLTQLRRNEKGTQNAKRKRGSVN